MAAETFISRMSVVNGKVDLISMRHNGQELCVEGPIAESLHAQAWELAAEEGSCPESAFNTALMQLIFKHSNL